MLKPCGLKRDDFSVRCCVFPRGCYPNFLRSWPKAWKKQRPKSKRSQTASLPSSIFVKNAGSQIGAFKYDCNMFIRRPVGGSLVNSIRDRLFSFHSIEIDTILTDAVLKNCDGKLKRTRAEKIVGQDRRSETHFRRRIRRQPETKFRIRIFS